MPLRCCATEECLLFSGFVQSVVGGNFLTRCGSCHLCGQGRAHIFKIHAKSMSCERDIRYELLARLCPNTTGADLRSVCTEAGMFAIRARRKVRLSSPLLPSVHRSRHVCHSCSPKSKDGVCIAAIDSVLQCSLIRPLLSAWIPSLCRIGGLVSCSAVTKNRTPLS